MKTKLNILLAFSLFLTLGSAVFAADGPNYRVTDHFIVGAEGGWDYLTYDADTARLFITRGTHVMVVDAATGKSLGDIPDTPGVHGVALAANLGVGAISNGKSGTNHVWVPAALPLPSCDDSSQQCSPHIPISTLRWDETGFRIPESGGSECPTRCTVSFPSGSRHIARSPASHQEGWTADSEPTDQAF
jgi:hypothetical protein